MMSRHLKDLKKSKVPSETVVVQLASPTVHAGKHVSFSPLLVNAYRSCPDCFLIEAKARAGFGAGTGTSTGTGIHAAPTSRAFLSSQTERF